MPSGRSHPMGACPVLGRPGSVYPAIVGGCGGAGAIAAGRPGRPGSAGGIRGIGIRGGHSWASRLCCRWIARPGRTPVAAGLSGCGRPGTAIACRTAGIQPIQIGIRIVIGHGFEGTRTWPVVCRAAPLPVWRPVAGQNRSMGQAVSARSCCAMARCWVGVPPVSTTTEPPPSTGETKVSHTVCHGSGPGMIARRSGDGDTMARSDQFRSGVASKQMGRVAGIRQCVSD